MSVRPRGRVCLILHEAGDWRLIRPSVQVWTLKSTDLASRIHPRGTEGPRGPQGPVAKSRELNLAAGQAVTFPSRSAPTREHVVWAAGELGAPDDTSVPPRG